MCCALFMAMLDSTAVTVALPSIQARFDASLAGLDPGSVERFFSSNFADMMGIDVSST